MSRTETITTTYYRFDELSDAAKATAIQAWREGLYTYPGNYNQDEAHESKLGIAKMLSVKSFDRRGERYPYRIEFSGLDFDPDEMIGCRLFKWLRNQCGIDRYLLGNCPFTGVCWDEDGLDHIRKFMARPDTQQTLTGIVQDCLESIDAAVINDDEWRLEDAQIIETLTTEDQEFTKNGKIL